MYGKFVEHSDQGDFEYGSFEVFYVEHGRSGLRADPHVLAPRGWYWWPCFPGCLPDGDAHGPFATAQDAFKAAREEE